MASSEVSEDVIPVFPRITHDDLLEQDNQLNFHNLFLPPLSPGKFSAKL